MGLLKEAKKRLEVLKIKDEKDKKLNTVLDDIILVLRKNKGSVFLDKLAEQLNVPKEEIENWSRILADHDIVQINYPTNIFSNPALILKKKDHKLKERHDVEKPIETYEIEADHVKAKIDILPKKNEIVPIYHLKIPFVPLGTAALLNQIAQELTDKIPVTVEDINEQSRLIELKNKIFFEIKRAFFDKEIKLSEGNLNLLSGIILHRIYGLGNIELIMSDPYIEEVVLNNADYPISIYHRKYGWLKSNVRIRDEEQIYNIVAQIGRKVGREITALNPIMDAHLLTGDRVAATLSPISQGNTLTIRKFARIPWTITHFIAKENNLMSIDLAAFLWQAIQYELSLMIAGGTASGKCVSGDTVVYLPNKRIKIKDLVEREFRNKGFVKTNDGFLSTNVKLNILSFNPESFKLEKKEVSKVWKREAPNELIEIKTKTGKNIRVTSEHPFFIFDNELKKIRADHLKEGISIATPRKIDVDNKEIFFSVKEIRCLKMNKNGKIYVRSSQNSNWMIFPIKLDKKLARFIGYVISEGHIPKRKDVVRFFNNNEILLNDFLDCGESVFGLKGKLLKYKNKVPYIQFSSVILVKYLTDIIEIPVGKKSHSVRIPSKLIFAKKGYLKELIKALFEGEAYIDKEKGQIEFSSSSRGLIEDVGFILAKFGIIHIVKNLKDRNRLFISGKDLALFRKEIGMFTSYKIKELDLSIKPKFSPNFDFIPNVGDLINELKNKLRMYEKEISGNLSREAISRYICNDRYPKRESLTEVAKNFKKRYNSLIKLKSFFDKNLDFDLDVNEKCIKLIQRIYKNINLNRKETGIISGVSPHTLWQWENFDRAPNLDLLNKLGATVINEFYDYGNNLFTIKDIRKLRISKKEISDRININKFSVWAHLRGRYYSQKIDDEVKKAINSICDENKIKHLDLNSDVLKLRTILSKYNNKNLSKNLKLMKKHLKINLSGIGIKKQIQKIKEILSQAASQEISQKINILENLAKSDILWDEIISIKKVKSEEKWVYDITVDGNHTFLANNLIVHNTSVLNALSAFIPPNQRIISIEDTKEINLPKDLHWNWVSLVSRNANPEGQGAVSMLDLMTSSLRMRPDRIIVGEVRTRQQAETLFEAMHTGHSVYSTMHADTVLQLKRRLLEPPIEIPKNEAEALQLILVQYRDRRLNKRKTLELAEILTSGKTDLDINYLYRWRPRTDSFEAVNNSVRVLEELNLHTGMTEQEIKDDLNEKQKILDWLLKNKEFDIDRIGKIMKIYYSNKDELLKAVKQGSKINKVI